MKEGSTNLIWIFCPNAEDFPVRQWNRPFQYFPGKEYADMIFVDAYEHHNKRAESLEGVLDYFYNELGLFMEVRRSAGDTLMLPFGLGEFATNRNDTKEKADWYSQSFRYLADVARIKIHFLYNAQHGSQDFSLTRLGIQLRSAYQQIRFQFGLLLALSI